MRATKRFETGRRQLGRIEWRAMSVFAGCIMWAAVLALAGCAGSGPAAPPGTGSADASASTSYGMAGPPVQVYVSRDALASTPKPWVLNTPQSAVRSYLDWISYAYRVAQSEVASPTMSAYEGVRVDSYAQYNVQKGRLIDQTLLSLTFGKASVGTTSTRLPARERWTYRYVSIAKSGEALGGPYEASYDSVYTLVKTERGWVVDSVHAEPIGDVK